MNCTRGVVSFNLHPRSPSGVHVDGRTHQARYIKCASHNRKLIAVVRTKRLHARRVRMYLSMRLLLCLCVALNRSVRYRFVLMGSHPDFPRVCSNIAPAAILGGQYFLVVQLECALTNATARLWAFIKTMFALPVQLSHTIVPGGVDYFQHFHSVAFGNGRQLMHLFCIICRLPWLYVLVYSNIILYN